MGRTCVKNCSSRRSDCAPRTKKKREKGGRGGGRGRFRPGRWVWPISSYRFFFEKGGGKGGGTTLILWHMHLFVVSSCPHPLLPRKKGGRTRSERSSRGWDRHSTPQISAYSSIKWGGRKEREGGERTTQTPRSSPFCQTHRPFRERKREKKKKGRKKEKEGGKITPASCNIF